VTEEESSPGDIRLRLSRQSVEAPITRLAVIGDVHAEDARLRTALDSIATMAVDVVACTGDVADGYGSVEACCRLLHEHQVACVRGNHDRWLFSGLLRDRPKATDPPRLSAEDCAFLRALPATRAFALHGGGSLLLCHGIGESDLDRVKPLHTDYTLLQNRAMHGVLSSGYRVMVNGHSHERLVRDLGGLTIVNAGTLAHAEDPGFVVLDFGANTLEWHAISGGGVRLAERREIFTGRS
jgi:predicted phosphodiesterase